MWTEPSLALSFNNPEEFLRKWSERMCEARDSGLTLVDIYGLNFLSAFAKVAGNDTQYNAAVEEFDQGFKDEKALNLWIENTVNNWQKFQAMNPARKPKQDKDAMKTIGCCLYRNFRLPRSVLIGQGLLPPLGWLVGRGPLPPPKSIPIAPHLSQPG